MGDPAGTGVYRGDYAHDFIAHQLRDLGVSTFGDLRLDDDELPPEQRYRLVVTAADVTTGQLVRLPWDYHRLYGLDPDEQPVADAVRASMSIPFVFRPVTLTSVTGRESTSSTAGCCRTTRSTRWTAATGRDPGGRRSGG